MNGAGPKSAPRKVPRKSEFIAGDALIPGEYEGRLGVWIAVRLASYRSLPLSCIAGIEVTIDGTQIASEELVLRVGGVNYRLDQLKELRSTTWYVLDSGALFIPATLTEGSHEVNGLLHLLIPYSTSGRVVRSSSSSATIPLGPAEPTWM